MTMRELLGRIRGDERGLAFVEFAFVAPVMIFAILGGLELVNYAMAYMKVNQIAMTVADNAGRVTTGIDEANIYEVFAGANSIGESMNFKSRGRIVLSSLQDNEKKGNKHGQVINWQRCWGDLAVSSAYGKENDGRNDSSLKQGMGAAANRITSISGTAVMFVEVNYDYQPLISATILPITTRIHQESAFNVRGRQNNNISNAQALAKNTC